MDWRKRKRPNGLKGKKRGAEKIIPDPEDVQRLRDALDSDAKFKYQDLIDEWRKAFDDSKSYEKGSHITPINGEGEES